MMPPASWTASPAHGDGNLMDKPALPGHQPQVQADLRGAVIHRLVAPAHRGLAPGHCVASSVVCCVVPAHPMAAPGSLIGASMDMSVRLAPGCGVLAHGGDRSMDGCEISIHRCKRPARWHTRAMKRIAPIAHTRRVPGHGKAAQGQEKAPATEVTRASNHPGAARWGLRRWWYSRRDQAFCLAAGWRRRPMKPRAPRPASSMA